MLPGFFRKRPTRWPWQRECALQCAAGSRMPAAATMGAVVALIASVAFVAGEEKITEPEKRSVQRPRLFYRREQEARPFVIAKP